MTNTTKKRAVVVCPGRGTYNKPELGFLTRHHSDKKSWLATLDDYRTQQQQPTITSLDESARFQPALHTAGEHASALIYACAAADYHDIDQEQFDIVAVTGNSMGWYIACAVAGALDGLNGLQVINTMGGMMANGVIGGQLIYPCFDEHWQADSQRYHLVDQAIGEVNQQSGAQVYVSIELGAYRVLAGNEKGLQAIQAALPTIDDMYPMRLHNHAAFHSPLLENISQMAKSTLSESLFSAPKLPMIDGRGHIWQPHSCNTNALWDYTLGHQVVQTYDFSRAIEVALKEFAPDCLIITGPGTTLGGAVGQCLVQHNWWDITNKADFIDRQTKDPVVYAMGMDEQRKQIIRKSQS